MEADRISLEDVCDVSLLKKIWRRFVRKRLLGHRFQELELARDPLEWLAFDWELDQAITTLRTDALAGRYRARPPEVLRCAKAVGLTRPLAYIHPLDLLLYKAIVSTAEASLLGGMPTWSRPGRFDARTDDEAPAESGWFRSFLRRQGQIWRITQNHDVVVETDIANYFPYIHLPTVSAIMLENSRLSQRVVRVLEHMLTVFSPMTEYRTRPTLGLPQDGFDCSRVIAHAYLKAVDDEFQDEGGQDRYSRYMDDIVIGANSNEEALGQVQRVQLALERVGLYPNTAKTRILPQTEFVSAYLKDENDFLGEVEERLRKRTTIDRSEFRERLRHHLRVRPRPARSWVRVLRRYYTLSRRLEDETLLSRAFDHLAEFPDSARHVFDYLSVFRLTSQRFQQLSRVLEELQGVYEDVDLLAYKYVAAAPNLGPNHLNPALGDWAIERVEAYLSNNPRLASSAIVVAAKFGSASHLKRLEELVDTSMSADTVARQQAVIALLGARRLEFEDLRSLPPAAGSQALSHMAFLRAVSEGEPRAVEMVMKLLKPMLRNDPRRRTCRPRMLFLAPFVVDVDRDLRPRLSAYRDDMRINRPRMRDHAAEEWLLR
jgi:hypothetical protein